jgi:outer membrane biosynthesis protein TonB
VLREARVPTRISRSTSASRLQGMPDPNGSGFSFWWSILYRSSSIFYLEKPSNWLELKAIDIVITGDPSKLLETIMKNTTRNTLLITAALTALVAGAGLASAQDVNREAPSAHDQKAPDVKTDRQPGATQQKSTVPTAQAPEKGKPAPTAQAPEKGKPAPTAQLPEKGKPAPTAEAPEKAKPAPTAQAPEKPADSKAQTIGQGGAAQPSQSSKGGAPAPAALSTEQHVKIRETLRGEKVEHLNNVQFSITVGQTVPRTVHLYRFPVSTTEYAPQYRGYEYFLVGDDILVVDPSTLRIVAVIPA